MFSLAAAYGALSAPAPATAWDCGNDEGLSFLASEPYGHQEGVRAFNASCICFALTSFAAAAFALAVALTTVATSALIFAVASRTGDWWLHQCLDIKTSHPVDEQYCISPTITECWAHRHL